MLSPTSPTGYPTSNSFPTPLHICDKPVFPWMKLCWTLPYLRPSEIPWHFLNASQTPHMTHKLPFGDLTPPPCPVSSSATLSTCTLGSHQIIYFAVPGRPQINHSSFDAHSSFCWEVSLYWDKAYLPALQNGSPYHFLRNHHVPGSALEASYIYIISLMLRRTVRHILPMTPFYTWN